jgi:hypothetical protein
MMRKHNPQTSEDGFHFLLPHAAEFIDELMAEFNIEKDHGLRCWLLELIGDARSAKAFDLLREQLRSSDEGLRYWAIHGLRELNTPEARQALFDAGVPKGAAAQPAVAADGRVGRFAPSRTRR